MEASRSAPNSVRIEIDSNSGRLTLVVCAVEGAIIVAKAQRSTRALGRVEQELRTLVSHVE